MFLYQKSLIPVIDHPPAHLQKVCFCINRVSILSLIIPAFLLIGGAFLHQQSLIPLLIIPCTFLLIKKMVCFCINSFSFLSLTIPFSFLLIGGMFPY